MALAFMKPSQLGLLIKKLCIILLLPTFVWAHGDLHQRIQILTNKIKIDNKDPELFLKRAELYRQHQEWSSAIKDFKKVRELNPQHPLLSYLFGKLLIEANKPIEAKKELDQFIKLNPNHGPAFLYRARTWVKLKNKQEAEKDYNQAIHFFSPPEPDLYLERANIVFSMGKPFQEKALQGLDEGIKTIGPIVTLINQAINFEREIGKYKQAIKRIELLPEKLKSHPFWLNIKGDILIEAGKNEEAKQTFYLALKKIKSFSARRQQTRATKKLEEEIQQKLVSLDPSKK